jgi:hypothetical protein
MTLPAGTYWIIVDGAGPTQRGTFTLHVIIATPAIPANDACASATPITPTTTLQSVSGDTTLATSDNGVCAGAPASPAGPDVWYRFELRNAGAVYFSTQDGRTWDSVLHLRAGACTNAEMACSDDACGSGNLRSQIVRILPAGTYYLAVDGLGASSFGSFDLYYQASDCVSAIDGDVMVAGIQPLPPGGVYQLGTTELQGNDSTGACASGSGTTQTAPDVYYYLGLCPGRVPTFDTCSTATGFDTVLYARYGSCWPDAIAGEVACNNDRPTGGPACAGSFGGTSSRITFPAARAQGLYYVWVDGFNGPDGSVPAEGSYGLNISGL